MNTKYSIIIAVFAIAIILGSVAAYIYLAQPTTPKNNPKRRRSDISLSPPRLNDKKLLSKRESQRPNKLSINRQRRRNICNA